MIRKNPDKSERSKIYYIIYIIDSKTHMDDLVFSEVAFALLILSSHAGKMMKQPEYLRQRKFKKCDTV